MTQQTTGGASKLDEIIKQLISRQTYARPTSSPLDVIKTQAALKDPQSAAGAALGKLIRQLYDDWKFNYDERGRKKEAKQSQLTTQFNNQYGDQAGAVIQDLKNQGIWDKWDKLRQFDPSTYNNPNVPLSPSEAAQQAQPSKGNGAGDALPATGFLGKDTPLTQAAKNSETDLLSENNFDIDLLKYLSEMRRYY